MAMSAAPVASSSSRTSWRCFRGMTSVWPGWNCRKSTAANIKSFSQTMLPRALPRAIAQKTHPSAVAFSWQSNRSKASRSFRQRIRSKQPAPCSALLYHGNRERIVSARSTEARPRDIQHLHLIALDELHDLFRSFNQVRCLRMSRPQPPGDGRIRPPGALMSNFSTHH